MPPNQSTGTETTASPSTTPTETTAQVSSAPITQAEAAQEIQSYDSTPTGDITTTIESALDLFSQASRDTNGPAPKKETEAPVVPATEEAQDEAQAETQVETPVVITTPKGQKIPLPPRKLDNLDAQEASWFKNMDRKAYEALYPKYIESKQKDARLQELEAEVAKVKDYDFYANDQAWTLHPEYNQLTKVIDNEQFITQHLSEQLARIEAGEEWIPLEHDKDGNIVYGAKQPSTPQNKVKVYNTLMRSHQLQASTQGKLESLTSNFKQKHTEFMSRLSQVEDNIFKGIDKTKLEQAAKPFAEAIPAHLREQPAWKCVAKLMAINGAIVKQLNTSKGNEVTQQLKQRTLSNNGPAADSLQGGSSVQSNGIESALALMEKARMG